MFGVCKKRKKGYTTGERRTNYAYGGLDGTKRKRKTSENRILLGEIILSYLIDFIILNTIKYSWVASLHKSPVHKHVPVLVVGA